MLRLRLRLRLGPTYAEPPFEAGRLVGPGQTRLRTASEAQRYAVIGASVHVGWASITQRHRDML